MRRYTRKPIVERIFEKRQISASGCWEFVGAKNRYGYGLIQAGKRTGEGCKLVHRVVMGNPKGYVLHKCHNPSCFNPEHLHIGTQKDNISDMFQAGRRKYKHKLNKTIMSTIRGWYSTGSFSQRALARRFNVSQCVIFKVLHDRLRAL